MGDRTEEAVAVGCFLRPLMRIYKGCERRFSIFLNLRKRIISFRFDEDAMIYHEFIKDIFKLSGSVENTLY